jgi:hypothetical protein
VGTVLADDVEFVMGADVEATYLSEGTHHSRSEVQGRP